MYRVSRLLCKVVYSSRPTDLSIAWAFIAGIIYSILSERTDRKLLLIFNVTSNTVAKGYFYAICTRSIPFERKLRHCLRAILQGYFYNVFDVRLPWVTSLFYLVGGGKIVFDTITLAAVAEAVPASSL